jgi:hypothetical protein
LLEGLNADQENVVLRIQGLGFDCLKQKNAPGQAAEHVNDRNIVIAIYLRFET